MCLYSMYLNYFAYVHMCLSVYIYIFLCIIYYLFVCVCVCDDILTSQTQTRLSLVRNNPVDPVSVVEPYVVQPGHCRQPEFQSNPILSLN